METLMYWFWYPLQEACYGSQIANYYSQKFLRKPPEIMKIVPKVAYEMFILADFSCIK